MRKVIILYYKYKFINRNLQLELVTLVWELFTEEDERPRFGVVVVARELLDVVVLVSYCESLFPVLFNLWLWELDCDGLP